jgi:hypothetical protein
MERDLIHKRHHSPTPVSKTYYSDARSISALRGDLTVFHVRNLVRAPSFAAEWGGKLVAESSTARIETALGNDEHAL